MEFEPEMHENSDKNEDASESNTVKESLTSADRSSYKNPKVGSKRSRCEDEDSPPLAIVVKSRSVKSAISLGISRFKSD